MIEVNGVNYRKKEQPQRKPMSKTMASLLLMAGMYGGLGSSSKQKEEPRVDIVKEYGLIQLKKSLLSKSQRDWVVWQFEKNFEPVPPQI